MIAALSEMWNEVITSQYILLEIQEPTDGHMH